MMRHSSTRKDFVFEAQIPPFFVGSEGCFGNPRIAAPPEKRATQSSMSSPSTNGGVRCLYNKVFGKINFSGMRTIFTLFVASCLALCLGIDTVSAQNAGAKPKTKAEEEAWAKAHPEAQTPALPSLSKNAPAKQAAVQPAASKPTLVRVQPNKVGESKAVVPTVAGAATPKPARTATVTKEAPATAPVYHNTGNKVADDMAFDLAQHRYRAEQIEDPIERQQKLEEVRKLESIQLRAVDPVAADKADEEAELARKAIILQSENK
jgi:hypothetical protein